MTATAARADFRPRAINVFLSSGKSAETLHGSATVHSIHFELAGRADWMKLRDTDVGVALTYSEVRQPQLLFPPAFYSLHLRCVFSPFLLQFPRSPPRAPVWLWHLRGQRQELTGMP